MFFNQLRIPVSKLALRIKAGFHKLQAFNFWHWIFISVVVHLLHSYAIDEMSEMLGKLHSLAPAIGGHFPLWGGWDSAWYAGLAENYNNPAFPPIYPMLLGFLKNVVLQEPNFSRAAVYVNLFGHTLFLYSLFHYLELNRKQSIFYTAALLTLFYPYHNVYFALYSESLYLGLSAFSFLLYQKDRPLLASVVAALSTLVRTMGSFLLSALLVTYLYRWLVLNDEKAKKGFFYSSVGVAIVGAWHIYVKQRFGVTVFEAQGPWTYDIQLSMAPYSFVEELPLLNRLLNYRDPFSWPFLIGIAAIFMSFYQKRYYESFYLLAFILSFFVHIYMAGSVPRFFSVMFPLAIFLSHLLRKIPVVLYLFIAMSMVHAYLDMYRMFHLDSLVP